MSEVTRGSGNVFADLGFENAPHIKLQARLSWLVSDLIAEQKLSPRVAATRCGWPVETVRALLRGDFPDLSTESLLDAIKGLAATLEQEKAPARTRARKTPQAARVMA
ncbi:MAG: XRE family transcriptional regulator [Acidobacteria bacterium]|nr:XRE family transcriptional regulator [Acidobacteriota bacterium]